MVIANIVKKEIYKFFSNKKTFFTVVFLPGLVVWIVYSFMGRIMAENISQTNYKAVEVYVVDALPEVKEYLASAGLMINELSLDKIDFIKKRIEGKENCVLVVFEEHKDKHNNVSIYYNSSNAECKEMFSYVPQVLSAYEMEKYNLFCFNTGEGIYNLSTNNNSVMDFVSSIMPMLLLGLVFSASMSIAAEAIAGEKERGTLNTLLMTPINRESIAIGKVLAICVVSSCSAFSSYLGTMFAIPSLIKSSMVEVFSVFGIGIQLKLFVVLVSTVLLMVSMMSVVSSLSKTVKEATTSLAPFTAFSLLIGMTCLSEKTITSKAAMYLLPFYNSAQLIFSIFKLEDLPLQVVLTVLSNLVYSILAVALLANILKKERYTCLG